jgi:SAM-dependent methyltransferase
VKQDAFDRRAGKYDAWYDSAHGRAVFRAEVACLRRVAPAVQGTWLEVGVGSGRFCRALGVPFGLDPSRRLLRMACARGIKVVQAVAEALPLRAQCLDGILLACTLCFLDAPDQALGEFARVLRPGGQLLVGLIPADGPWGRLYAEKGRQGHPLYSGARFFTVDQAVGMASGHGFDLAGAAATLPGAPDAPRPSPAVTSGTPPGHGFVALLFRGP